MNYNKEIVEVLDGLKESLENFDNNITAFTSNLEEALNVYYNCDIYDIKNRYDNLSTMAEDLYDFDLNDSEENINKLYINESKYIYLNTKINNFIDYIDNLDITDLDEKLYRKIEIAFDNFHDILEKYNLI